MISDNDLWTTFCNIPFPLSIDESTLTSLPAIVPFAMLIKSDEDALKGLCISRKSMRLRNVCTLPLADLSTYHYAALTRFLF